MGFSYNKAMLLRPSKERWLSTFLIALFTATAIFLPFIIKDNGYFIFFGDFNVQQIPFYKMCHQAVRTGSFGWNELTDLGANFMGSYSFYLIGSPFFWLTLPFPSTAIPYLMGPLLILKFACSALTAYFYIRRFTRTAEAARLGGILYAFSGFSVYNIFFNHFHEAIVVFPLLLLGLELILTENRRGVFAFSVFLAAVSNFYFFFGMVIFVFIYFIIRVCSGGVKLTFGRFLTVALEAVIGVLMAATLLLPTVLELLSNPRIDNLIYGWNAITYGNEQIYLNIIECFFFPPDIPARPVFFPGANVKWSSLGGWLPLFGMIGVFAFTGAKKGHWLKRLICTSFVFAMFPVLNSSFSALTQSYYARWFYMPILAMSLATVMAIEQRDIDFKSAFKWVTFITLAIALVIGFFPQKDKQGNLVFGLYTNAPDKTYMYRFFVTCAIALVAIFACFLIFKIISKRGRGFTNLAVTFVCVFSIIYAVVFINTGKQHSHNVQNVMIDSLIEADVELDGDSDRFRIDTYDCPDNTGVFLGYQSVNAFHSIVPASVVEFYEYVGESRTVASRPDIKNHGIRNLLSVRYLLSHKNQSSFVEDNGTTKMPGYAIYGTDSGYEIYENINYIPMGFSYDSYISRAECDSYGTDKRALMMLKAIVLEEEQIQKYSSMLNHFSEDALFDNEATANDCKERSEHSAESFAYTNTGFTSDFNSEKNTLVFFSVPYAEGWSATVNGRHVEIEKVNIGFMAVAVEAGENRIEFTYRTPGLYYGIIYSIVGAAIFVIYIIICFATAKRRKSQPVIYPEGEQLLEMWQKYDAEDASEEIETQQEDLTLDDIANSLETEYPTYIMNDEFMGGFNVRRDAFGDKEKKDLDK